MCCFETITLSPPRSSFTTTGFCTLEKFVRWSNFILFFSRTLQEWYAFPSPEFYLALHLLLCDRTLKSIAELKWRIMTNLQLFKSFFRSHEFFKHLFSHLGIYKSTSESSSSCFRNYQWWKDYWRNQKKNQFSNFTVPILLQPSRRLVSGLSLQKRIYDSIICL